MARPREPGAAALASEQAAVPHPARTTCVRLPLRPASCPQVRPVLLLAALYVAALTLIVLLFARLPNLEQMAGEGRAELHLGLVLVLLAAGAGLADAAHPAHSLPLASPHARMPLQPPPAMCAHSCACPPVDPPERHAAAAAEGAGPEGQLQLSLAVPHSFDELRAVRRTLELYRQNYAVHVAALLVAAHVLLQVRGRAASSPAAAAYLFGGTAAAACWSGGLCWLCPPLTAHPSARPYRRPAPCAPFMLQTFMIPGSILINVLAGSMYSLPGGPRRWH